MSLPDWERNGWLTRHQTSRNEIRDLLQVVERDLADSAAEGLSSDWRMNIAYNAGLQAATAALAAAGYRASRDAHHFRVIQSLSETIGRRRVSRSDLRRVSKEAEHHGVRAGRLFPTRMLTPCGRSR